jgi:hypothetical protein
MATLGVTLPWVVVFSFMLMANVSFGLVAEERKKHLFTSLRRMGLIDSAYWAAWFVLFQLLLVLAVSLSLVAAALVRPSSSALRELDLSLAFVVLWMCGSAFLSLSFFLAALCSSSSVETSVTFAQFLIAMITIISCFSPLSSYTYVEDEMTGHMECKLVSSSYNGIYSDELLGNTFVEFLVWWMPFFHSAQVVTNIISVIQYEGQTISLADLGSPPMPLSYSAASSDTYETKWVQWGLLMLLTNTLAYLFLAWFTAQLLSSDASEGRSLQNILLPASVRRYLFREKEAVVAGDVRGEERLKSEEERSVRAYKVGGWVGWGRDAELSCGQCMPCCRNHLCNVNLVYLCICVFMYSCVRMSYFPLLAWSAGQQDLQRRAGFEGSLLHDEARRGVCDAGTQWSVCPSVAVLLLFMSLYSLFSAFCLICFVSMHVKANKY